MRFTVELSNRAEADIEESYSYIAKDSPQNGLKWRFDLEDKIRTLATLAGASGPTVETATAGAIGQLPP